MVVVLKPGVSKGQIKELSEHLATFGVKPEVIYGAKCAVIGLVGDTSEIDERQVAVLPVVDKVLQVEEPFKKANRKFHPDDTVIKSTYNQTIGGKKIAIIAGPCSVESREQLFDTARGVKAAGGGFLRGGVFKPRTSPYAFTGLKMDGLELLKEAREEFGMPIVTELMDARHLDAFERDVDVIQIGARNMYNYDLLKEVGGTSKPVLLKRGFSTPVEEFLLSAEHIMAAGNPNVILCERGMRTVETFTRNTLDLSVIPAIKKLSHLPVVVDPSHATGWSWMVPSMSKAAIAAGADGLIIEVHNNPATALCDGAQSLDVKQFTDLMGTLKEYIRIEGREL